MISIPTGSEDSGGEEGDALKGGGSSTGGGTFEALAGGGAGAAGSNEVPAGFNNQGWASPVREAAKGAGSALLSGLWHVGVAFVRAPYVMVHDTVCMPIDAATGTQYSYAAEANAQRLRRGDSVEDITYDTYRSISTFGIADYLDA